ncbi:hypothetical protein J6590_058766 [Homalodisca vitripennis]|nr:hypothetical protein J6590_058766 [Homalodisca vitripennis]
MVRVQPWHLAESFKLIQFFFLTVEALGIPLQEEEVSHELARHTGHCGELKVNLALRPWTYAISITPQMYDVCRGLSITETSRTTCLETRVVLKARAYRQLT